MRMKMKPWNKDDSEDMELHVKENRWKWSTQHCVEVKEQNFFIKRQYYVNCNKNRCNSQFK